MDIAVVRWREIYKVIEQKVREDMKERNGENRKTCSIKGTTARSRHLWQKGKYLI